MVIVRPGTFSNGMERWQMSLSAVVAMKGGKGFSAHWHRFVVGFLVCLMFGEMGVPLFPGSIHCYVIFIDTRTSTYVSLSKVYASCTRPCRLLPG